MLYAKSFLCVVSFSSQVNPCGQHHHYMGKLRPRELKCHPQITHLGSAGARLCWRDHRTPILYQYTVDM